ncbi:Golgi apparatus membrane protein [Lachnellula hyalina]|uniref:Golgi apparatus membrane protein TVP38 n=1 Tax=Lachnellula hyalina TaxID=1316788 RepID=A0A8H8QWE7_9HELO|nr:Golgi apparatus membrane protein [Lachnellula hyalina]TVY23993.1 Golgi apparatus membrane protein [Lachnellula hyalina]
MDRSHNISDYPEAAAVSHTPQEQDLGAAPRQYAPYQPAPSAPDPFDASIPEHLDSTHQFHHQYDHSRDFPPPPTTMQPEPFRKSKWKDKSSSLLNKKLSKKWQRRLYWMVPLGILTVVFSVLFEVYKKDFERWVKPLTDWLRDREAWSWTLPTLILVILSFPPLFGHEIVQLIVGLTYPLGVAIGIACAGAVLGEAACFVAFKYLFTEYVHKKIDQQVKWAAIARVTQEAGFRGVLVIRYSIVPPHLANPLFSCTGMKFWVYMATVFLSLPKSMVFVALGSPSSEGSKAAKWGKVVAIGIVVIISGKSPFLAMPSIIVLFASWWIRKKLIVATREIKAERGVTGGEDEEYQMLTPPTRSDGDETSYHGVESTAPSTYEVAATR